MHTIHQIILISIISTIGTVLSGSDYDEIIAAVIISRHGDRSIFYNNTYPDDPWANPKYWPEGYGRLTEIGKQQHYELGILLRKHFDRLCGGKAQYAIRVFSSDTSRTIESAESNVAGFFSVDENGQQLSNSIEIERIPREEDTILLAKKRCPKYRKAIRKYKRTAEYKQMFEIFKITFHQMKKSSGRVIRTIGDAQNFYNALSIENLKNMTLPDWAELAIIPGGELEFISNYCFQLPTMTNKLARLKAGFFIREILDRLASKTKSASSALPIWMYFGHDTTIANVLNALGLFQPHAPDYTATILFELYKSDDDFYVEISYKKSTVENFQCLEIPKCGNECSLERMYQLYKPILPTDSFNNECRVRRKRKKSKNH